MPAQSDSTFPPPGGTGSLPTAASAHARRQGDEVRGMWLGVLGVAMFAATLPMTRLATGSAAAPQLSPWFLTLGRAALAGLLSAAVLLAVRAPWPQRRHWLPLGMGVLGNLLGYPLLLALALRTVPSGHAAVVTALMPLATAAIAAVVLHQRAPLGFWLCAVAGAALVVTFAVLRAAADGHGFLPGLADLLLFGAVVAGALGYVYGARATAELGAERTICWITALSLPFTLPCTLWLWPAQPVAASAWGGFLYCALFSMWIGFFAWYRGLALGGTLRVSQTQLLQPFFAIVFAVPLLGEPVEPQALLFAGGVIATVLLGRRLARRPAERPTAAFPVAPTAHRP